MTHAVVSRFAIRACIEDPNLWTSDDDTDRQIALGGCLECPFLADCREQTVDSIDRGDIPAGVVQAGIAFDDAGAVDSDAHTIVSARELAAQINRPFSAPSRRSNPRVRRDAQEEDLPNLSPEQIRHRLALLDPAARSAHSFWDRQSVDGDVAGGAGLTIGRRRQNKMGRHQKAEQATQTRAVS